MCRWFDSAPGHQEMKGLAPKWALTLFHFPAHRKISVPNLYPKMTHRQLAWSLPGTALPFEAIDLLRWAYARFQLKSDSELSRLLSISLAEISNTREGKLRLSWFLVLEAHSLSGMSFQDFQKSVADAKQAKP